MMASESGGVVLPAAPEVGFPEWTADESGSRSSHAASLIMSWNEELECI